MYNVRGEIGNGDTGDNNCLVHGADREVVSFEMLV